MSFIPVLFCTTVAVFALRRPLKRYSMLFYSGAVLLNILYLVSTYALLPEVLRKMVFLLMQKCTLSLALFTVVMYIGLFRKDSMVALALRPIRAELSILACILTTGHMGFYLVSLMPRMLGGGFDARFAVFFMITVMLLVLLLVLGVTSFDSVKCRMSAPGWMRLQKWAYVFFGLVYMHMLSILLPAAFSGGRVAQSAVAVYTVLFALYAGMRIGRAVVDRSARTTE